MSAHTDFEGLLADSVRVRPATTALADRVSARVLSRLDEQRARRPVGRTWALATAAVAVVVLLAMLLRDENLTPALQLSRMASAAEGVEVSHWVVWSGPGEGELQRTGEAWLQPPLYKQVSQQGEVRQASGFDGEVSWGYDTQLRKVSVQPDQRPALRHLPRLIDLQSDLERTADGGSLTVERVRDAAGEPIIRVTADSTSMGERAVAEVDPHTNLPRRIDFYKRERDASGFYPATGPWARRQRYEISYPGQPLPPEFFQCDAPADYPRVGLPAIPAAPPTAPLRERFNGPGLASVPGPGGVTVRLVDVARRGDLLFVAVVLDGEVGQIGSLKVVSSVPNGYLTVRSFIRAPKHQRFDEPLLDRTGTIAGQACCLATADSPQPTVKYVEAFVLAGQQSRTVQLAVHPGDVRDVTELPDWWLLMSFGGQGFANEVARARVTHWLPRAPQRAVAYAEALTADQSGPANSLMCKDWGLLAAARAQAGDRVGALAAIDRGLALVPGLDPAIREHTREELLKRRDAVQGASSP